MSFREKIHWVAFFSMAAAFGWYFLSYPWDMASERAGLYQGVWMLLPVTLICVIPMIAASAFFAVRSPKEAHLKEDEREYGIHVRGTHFAYYPLVLGCWALIFALINGVANGWLLNLMIATVVLAELVRVGSQIWLYRRGA